MSDFKLMFSRVLSTDNKTDSTGAVEVFVDYDSQCLFKGENTAVC